MKQSSQWLQWDAQIHPESAHSPSTITASI